MQKAGIPGCLLSGTGIPLYGALLRHYPVCLYAGSDPAQAGFCERAEAGRGKEIPAI